jgi:ATPase family protein associated with various cellular activities (AAA)
LSNDLKPLLHPPVNDSSPRPLAFAAVPPSSASDAKRDQFCLINSRKPIITAETSLEQRFSSLLERVVTRLAIPLYTWSVTTGLARVGGAALCNSDQPEQALANIAAIQGDAIFLLKDFARYCDNDHISRKLRDLADGFRTARRSIILLAAALSLPLELSADSMEFSTRLTFNGGVASAMAADWGHDLVRLDAGALYDKFVGESEKHLRKTLELAQKLAPVVLWIEEIEKAFASAGSCGDADAGLSQRLLATLLTWMQDREGSVFLAATSNNMTVLPPEMLRKGRFDEISFVDLPNPQIRAALFALHLKKRGRDPAGFDTARLAQASEGYSGAEIEQPIVSALYTAFSQKRQLSTDILLSELQSTQPLSVTRSEEITSIREWAKNRATPAD